MHDFPTRVTIRVPSHIETLHGRASTCLPHGVISSIRLPRAEADVIDRACKIIDLDLSRGGFIRLAAYRTAVEICKHYDGQYSRPNEEDDDDANHGRTVRSTQES